VTTVGRYLDETPPVTLNKFIQPGELDVIFRNGLRVFPLSEYAGTTLSYFTYQQGWDDARKAHDRASGVYQFDTGTVIYFAVDYDATQADIDSSIAPYFDGIVAGLASKGKKYVHAVYGSRNVCAEITRRSNARWSFVSDMSYGFSGNMGYPLPDNWSFNQIQTTTIGSGAGAVQIDRDVARPGADPGAASVGNAGTPVDAFVDYIAMLYDLAQSYTGSDRDKSRLVLEFLRSRSYDDSMWWALIGTIDHGFVDYVAGQNIGIMPDLREPFYGIDIHVEHWAASCDGALVVAPATGTASGRADVAGWGGDWMTFYGEWRRDSASYSSGLTYCQDKLAKLDGDGTFKLRDLIEDADAWNIAQRLNAGVQLPDAVDDYYRGTGFLSRMSTYFTGRFGSATDCQAIAKDMLTTSTDPVIVTGRTTLITQTGGTATLAPAMLPGTKLDEFCQGFAGMMVAQTAQEAHAAARRAAATTPLEAPRG
jgi:peptidoglycan hydrolase-like protein with peptidoglycan-binding domain